MMNNFTKTISSLFLAASLLLTPAFALADRGNKSDSERNLSGQTELKARTGTDNGKGNDGKNRGLGTSNSGPGRVNSIHGLLNRHHDDDECAILPANATSSLRMFRHDDDEGKHKCRVATTTPPIATPPSASTTPIESGITASTGTSTAAIAFTTDVPAVSTLFYGTQNPFSFVKVLGSPSELTSHAFSLVGLAANTTYFYVVLASNAIGTAVSNILTFTTSAIADVTSPIVSSVTATSTSVGSATLSWTTNEPSTSKVFFSTTTPLNLLTTTSMNSTSLVTNHSITVTTLATTTTYHFVVSSTDASGNTATSSDISFLVP